MLKVNIAGISLRVCLNAQNTIKSYPNSSGLSERYERFVVRDTDSSSINFVTSDFEILRDNNYKYYFDSSGLWKLYYNSRSEFMIEFKNAPEGVNLAFIDVKLNNGTGTIFYSEDGSKDPRIQLLPFVYPVDEVIFINLLPSFNGVLLHACGIDDNGKGYVFLGTSRAGKSTTAKLWLKEGAKVLSDDRIIIRQMDGKFYAYGTPWHGEIEVYDPGRVKIEKIFFLEHAEKNYTISLSAMDAATRMFVRCFPTFWDKEGMAFTLKFIDEIVKEIPCYELGFVPDRSAVEFVGEL